MMKKMGLVLWTMSTFASAQIQPELVLQFGHSSHITCVAYSDDGTLIATGGFDNSVIIWDARSLKELRVLTGHSGFVTNIVFSHDNAMVASTGASGSGTIIWNVVTGKEIFRDKKDGPRIYFSKDDRHFVWVSDLAYDQLTLSTKEQKVSIFNYDAPTPLFKDKGVRIRFDIKKRVFALSSGGKYFAFIEHDSLQVWDIALAVPERIFWAAAKKADYQRLSFSNRENILTWSREINRVHTLSVIDLREKRIVKEFDPGIKDGFPESAFSPKDRYFIYSNHANSIKIFDAATFEEIRHLTGQPLTGFSASPDEKNLATVGGESKSVSLWNIETGELNRRLVGLPLLQHMAQTPDGKHLICAFEDRSFSKGVGRTVQVREVVSGKRISSVAVPGPFDMERVVPLSDGKRYFVSCSDSLRLYDLRTGSLLRTYAGTGTYKGTLTDLSRDNTFFVALTKDSSIQCVNIATGAMIRSFKMPLAARELVKVSPDGQTIVCAGGLTLRGADSIFVSSWNVRTGKKRNALKDHKMAVAALEFSLNGQYYATGSFDRQVIIRDAQTDAVLTRIDHGMGIIGAGVISLAFSPDSKTIASGGTDHMIRTWDVQTGKLIQAFYGNKAHVVSLAFSPDGRLLISLAKDGQLSYWNADQGTALATVLFMGDGYAYVAPDKYFTATKSVLPYVYYVAGMRSFSFDNFDLRYNRPDIVLSRLHQADSKMVDLYAAAHRKRLQKMGFAEDQLEGDFHLPEITIDAAHLAPKTSEKHISFVVKAWDALFELRSINVSCNGVPVLGSTGLDIRKHHAKSFRDTITLELSKGKNLIQVSVMNQKGLESLRETFDIEYTGPTREGTTYVVAIGVSEYQDTTYNLTFASKDAFDLTGVFESQRTNEREVKTLTLTNGDAVRENIAKIKDFLSGTKVDDYIIVFYAGHGLLDDSLNYFLAMHDMDFSHPSLRGLSYESLEGLLDGIPARNKLMLIDACHSGEVDKEESQLVAVEEKRGSVKARAFKKTVKAKDGIGLQNSFELMKELFADLRRNNGAVVISSASGKEYALESAEWKNGVFTYSILEGLRSSKADLNQDKTLTVSELRDYVGRRVQELTNGKQNPTSRTENLENDFRVW